MRTVTGGRNGRRGRRIDRLLGPTSGPAEGNVRAILAIALTAAFLIVFAAMLALRVLLDAAYLQEIVVGGFGALVSAFTLTVGVYIGKRSGEGARYGRGRVAAHGRAARTRGRWYG
jgi:hypothetical protein